MLKQWAKARVGDDDDETDDVPIRLTKGEMVVNKRATEQFEPILAAMNQLGNQRGGFAVGRPREHRR